MCRNCISEPDPVQLQEDLLYEEQPVQILDQREKQLCRKTVPLIKVLYASHEVSKVTWEPEHGLQEK